MTRVFDCAQPDRRRRGIGAAADAIAGGRLVVVPTDTVYGLAADAFSPEAVAGVLSAKGRDRDLPVPVLVGSWSGIDGLMTAVPDVVRELVRAFWPGGLTLVVQHAPTLAWDLGDAHGTVAVRMPLHPVALELLERTGPLAVSSANRTGQPPATTVVQARDQLGDDVHIYLDAGPSPGAVASTIVDVTVSPPRMLRAGAVSAEQLSDVVPDIEGIA
ncbi:MAG: threonylcarbamoyl-AMP synthase [Geodermatophilaceae bacterium]|nr:threonylcarbamoyl-AMP synthase [Geodermatophilaceae bacterium]